MNKNFKIVQIHGLSGLLIVGFITIGLFAGFIVFPIWAVMHIWNYIVAGLFSGPVINYYQSALLWSAVVLVIYLHFRNNVSIKIQKESRIVPPPSEEGINELKDESLDETEINKSDE